VEKTLRANIRVVLDFKDTSLLYPCGTLIFISRLDVWLEKFPGQLTCTYPDDEAAEQLLQRTDVLAKLGLTPRRTIDHERVKYWYLHSGTNTDARTYKDLTKTIREGIVHPDKELFADCLNEAVVNTVNHAYEFPLKRLPPKSQQKWWMFSLYMDRQLFVAIYDQGVGIPDSLRRKPEFLDYFKFRQYNDAVLIQDAIGSKLSRTRLPHRGKGLPEMLEFSQNLASGGLSIWSAHGGITYDASAVSDAMKEKRYRLSENLPGTLVMWSIPFREEQPNERTNDICT
jgi:hypothetical protein